MIYKKIFLLLLLPITMLMVGDIVYAENRNHLLIEIYKHNGSVQCEKNSGISILTMGRELEEKRIKIIEAKISHDGMSYIAMCGAPTGKINVYKINASDLKLAEKLGFVIYSNSGRNK